LKVEKKRKVESEAPHGKAKEGAKRSEILRRTVMFSERRK